MECVGKAQRRRAPLAAAVQGATEETLAFGGWLRSLLASE